ncbi:MAG: DNA topoisomerase VI subunit B, partial [Candidatus Diapherotrites archaeon]|nr:DNA topoisomerase VI subunit B [Candidatus Diapherotrites archaeon]
HPKGSTTDEIINLARRTESRKVSSMLKTEFSRMGSTSIRAIQKKISFDLESAPRRLSWAEAEEIVLAIKALKFMAPETDAVQPIGPAQIEKSIRNIISPEYLTVSERPPKVYQEGVPFQVECGIAYGGGAGRASRSKDGESIRSLEIIRYANRVPLLFDQGGCALTKAAQTVEWRRYGIKGGIDNAPVSIFLNINSVRVPYTGAGKTAVSDEEEIITEIRYALMDAGRKIEKYLKGKARDAELRKKKERLEKYVAVTAASIAAVANDNAENLKSNLQELVLKRFKELDNKQEDATEEVVIEDEAETGENEGEDE